MRKKAPADEGISDKSEEERSRPIDAPLAKPAAQA
jgi:hypothetical protein